MKHIPMNEALQGGISHYPPITKDSLFCAPTFVPLTPGVYCCIEAYSGLDQIEKLRAKYKILFECNARNMHHLHQEKDNHLHFFLFEIPETKETV